MRHHRAHTLSKYLLYVDTASHVSRTRTPRHRSEAPREASGPPPGRVVSWRARRRVAPAGTTSRCACHVPAHSAFAPPFISVVVGQAPPRSTARVWRGKRHTSQPDRTMHMPMQHTNCLALIGVSEVIMLRGHPPSFRNMTKAGGARPITWRALVQKSGFLSSTGCSARGHQKADGRRYLQVWHRRAPPRASRVQRASACAK